MSVRQAIVNAFQSVRATFDEKDVAALEARVNDHSPEHPAKFAFVVARNFAVARHRKARIAADRILAEERKAEETRRAAETERLVREEFSVLYRRLAPDLRPTQLRHLQLVSLVCLEGLNDQETSARFPGTTPAARWQWKKRGVDLLWPHASKALQEFLSCGTWKRR